MLLADKCIFQFCYHCIAMQQNCSLFLYTAWPFALCCMWDWSGKHQRRNDCTDIRQQQISYLIEGWHTTEEDKLTILAPPLNCHRSVSSTEHGLWSSEANSLTWDRIEVCVCLHVVLSTDTTPGSPVLPQRQLLLTTKRVAMAATSMEEERSRWCTVKDICLQVAASWT